MRPTKADAAGHKAERPGQRVVPFGRFEALHSLNALLERLFGPLPTARGLGSGRVEPAPPLPTSAPARRRR